MVGYVSICWDMQGYGTVSEISRGIGDKSRQLYVLSRVSACSRADGLQNTAIAQPDVAEACKNEHKTRVIDPCLDCAKLGIQTPEHETSVFHIVLATRL